MKNESTCIAGIDVPVARTYVHLADVMDAVRRSTARLHQRIAAIPDRLAGPVAAASDVETVRTIIQTELMSILEEAGLDVPPG